MPQPPTDDDHASVLKRLGEVASLEYPFPIPERVKPEKRQQIDLTSFRHTKPLFQSLALFWWNVLCPLFAVVFALVGWFWSSRVAVGLSVVCAVRTMSRDPFVVHFVTDGRFGGLGCGGGSGNDRPREGFFASNNARNERIRKRLERFVHYVPPLYLYSGDLLTLWPFLMFKGSRGGGRVSYTRYWVKVPSAPAPDGDDGPFKRVVEETDAEAVALDVVFPVQGYQSGKATFLVLHGLNGGSTEPYVLDLARRATKEGHTVAVMINRGLMKTPIRGDEIFHGARTSDVGCVVDVLHHALYGSPTSGQHSSGAVQSKIVLVGFSMGGIIAANYAAKSQDRSGIAGALCFSGTLSGIQMLKPDLPAAVHSASVWQPVLAWALKATILKPNLSKLMTSRKARGTGGGGDGGGLTLQDVEAVRSVLDIDRTLVCKYNGYRRVEDYYEDMSAGGSGDAPGLQRLHGCRVPLLAVHAIDDPIAVFEVMMLSDTNKPIAVAPSSTNTENVMFLVTKHGGHIGWPMGWFPAQNRWKFMMDITMEFATEVTEVSSSS